MPTPTAADHLPKPPVASSTSQASPSILPAPLRIPPSLARTMTGINWADFTINGHTVCTPIPASPCALSACDICYAKHFAAKYFRVSWGAHVPRHKFTTAITRLRRLDALAASTGLPFAVFANSLGDWLDAELPQDWRTEYLDALEQATHINILLLTHRPHLAAKLAPASWRTNLPAHIWPGVTIEHPAYVRRWGQLANLWADTGRAWISLEPLAASMKGHRFDGAAGLIVGGASNTTDPRWAFDATWVLELDDAHPGLVNFKQWGVFKDGVLHRSKHTTGRIIDGRTFDHTPWPLHRDLLTAAKSTPAPATAP